MLLFDKMRTVLLKSFAMLLFDNMSKVMINKSEMYTNFDDYDTNLFKFHDLNGFHMLNNFIMHSPAC